MRAGMQFPGLPAGSYSVAFVPPAGYSFTTPDQGGDDTADSDANVATGRTPAVTLTAGESNPTVDAGLILLDFGDLPDTTANVGSATTRRCWPIERPAARDRERSAVGRGHRCGE